LSDLLALRSFPDGLARLREHRKLGHRTVLITGALDFVVEPLRPLFDEMICGQLGERDGSSPARWWPLHRPGKPGLCSWRKLARQAGLERDQIVAYADLDERPADARRPPGLPVAVNPEASWRPSPAAVGWSIEHWSRTPGGPRRLLRDFHDAAGMRTVGAGRAR